MAETYGIIIMLGILILMLIIVFIKTNLVICQPNEVVIISGRKLKLPDGTEVGYRTLRGGRGFKIPIIEVVKRLPLTAIPVEINIKKALSKGIIPVNLDGRANIKIAGTEKDGLSNAIERFLGRNLNEIAQIAKQTIEGALRGVLATVTPEEANSERLKIADRIVQESQKDLHNLGILLDYFIILNISDEQGYLEAIGRKKNADIIKNAKIAETTAEAEARKIAAEQKQIAHIAEAEAEEKIVGAENKLAVHRAQLQSETNKAEEKAKVAGQIGRVEDEQLLENGKATAEAIRKMQEQWQEGNTKDLFVIQMFPELLDKVTRVISENLHIDKLTILDSGNGNGVPTHVKNLTNSAITILVQLKNTTGLDLAELLKNTLEKNSNSNAQIQKELL